MLIDLLKRVFRKLHAQCFTTSKKRLFHCGRNVIIERYFHSKNPERIKLGDHIYIGPYATMHSVGGVVIEDGVILGPNVTIYTNSHNYLCPESIPFDGIQHLKPVLIKFCAWIGGDVIILPGVTVGEGAVIGARSVVTKDVPDCSVVGGNPAKVLKYRDIDRFNELKKDYKIYLKLKSEGLGARRTKYLISRCDALVSARMHCAIGGLSVCTPTVCISYSEKSIGVLNDIYDNQEWVIKTSELSPEVLLAKVNSLLNNSIDIKEHLKASLPVIRDKVWKSGLEIKELIKA